MCSEPPNHDSDPYSDIRLKAFRGVGCADASGYGEAFRSLDRDCRGAVVRFYEIERGMNIADHCTGHDGTIGAVAVLAMLDCHVQRYAVALISNGDRLHHLDRSYSIHLSLR